MRSVHKLSILVVVLALQAAGMADSKPAASNSKDTISSSSAAADRIFYQEAKLVENMHKYTPLVETYIQEMQPDKDLGSVPNRDHYFLGRLILDEKGVNDKNFSDRKKSGMLNRVLDRLDSFYKMNYLPQGFMQLIFLNDSFDKDHYQLKYLRQQFLGEVRTLVFDVVPLKKKGTHFLGRIWVEDQDYNIVRLNGTYEPHARVDFYFHFDSWRINMQPGLWLPAYVYTEESDMKYALFRRLSMKGQTRLWAYDRRVSGMQSEFTDIQVESQNKEVADVTQTSTNEYAPVESQHLWEREAEDNVLDRMERAGILAPQGDLTKVLQTVVNNLEITNNLDIQPEVRCRVLLTTPLESFTVGHTIVVSRGLLDVLPDEASLAMVLAHELAHIALGHTLDTKYAFSDRMIFPDEKVFRQIGLTQKTEDDIAADQKAMELLQKSPYKDKLTNAKLFLKELDLHSQSLTWLISPHFGNSFIRGKNGVRMSVLEQSAPELDVRNINQLPALPLGSRVKLNAWDDRLELKKTKPVALLSARDKLSFEVTPIFPNLGRFKANDSEMAAQ